MLVAVFRAREDGERTAAKLARRGHAALLAPVFEVVRTGAVLPPGPFEGVIFTSPHGVESWDRTAATDVLLDRPCFCVGDRTAELAATRGFQHRHVGRADAERLAALVCSTLPEPARLLLVAGQDRKPAIERGLAVAGHRVTVAEVYAARALERWPDAAVRVFATGAVQAALHYSRRSAELALACAAAAGVLPGLRAIRHHCLSSDAAAPLTAAGASDIALAPEPNEDNLLALLPHAR